MVVFRRGDVAWRLRIEPVLNMFGVHVLYCVSRVGRLYEALRAYRSGFYHCLVEVLCILHTRTLIDGV